jgi:hypothetical protein
MSPRSPDHVLQPGAFAHQSRFQVRIDHAFRFARHPKHAAIARTFAGIVEGYLHARILGDLLGQALDHPGVKVEAARVGEPHQHAAHMWLIILAGGQPASRVLVGERQGIFETKGRDSRHGKNIQR